MQLDSALECVSDGDGAVAALSAALKLTDMQSFGDVLESDVIITTIFALMLLRKCIKAIQCFTLLRERLYITGVLYRVFLLVICMDN